ncbi:MAG: ABC-type transporter, periplasmic subunit [Clostridia bacterium]|jgi:oligopeptide transport system substrate-binding protein|nr:ABC-type transporter, periplasmic subunit [Clostridia bacterium]
MRKRHLKLVAVLLAVLMIGTILTSCTTKEQNTLAPEGGDKQPVTQDTLTFTVASVPSIDPQMSNSIPSMNVIKGFSEGLIRNFQGEVKPGMAEKWDISEDGMTYTFHLRDAKWSDGSSVTAQDFEYAIIRLLDPKNAASYSFAAYIIQNAAEFNSGKIIDPAQVGVKAIDEKTLEIKLINPTSYFVSTLDLPCFYPVKKDYVEKLGADFATAADKMLSNGPFILKDWKHEQEIVLERNPNYWDQANIKLNTVKILQVSDANTVLAMYENGEIDFCDVPTSLVDKFQQEGKAKVYMSGADDWMRINFKRTEKPWLQNVNFRKALNYAIDREDYVKTATKGLFFPATRLVLPLMAGVNGYYCEEYPINIYPTKADTAKAKEYLEKAMQELNITDPKQIVVAYTISDDDATKLMAEVLQDQVTKNLGITFEIKMVTYKQKLENDTKGDFDLVYNGWGPDYDDPMTYLELWETTNSQNGGKYSNAEFDKLIAAARVETDKVKRMEMFHQAETILLEDAGFVPLQFRQRAWVSKDNLKNLARFFIGADTDYVYAYFE